MKCSKSMQHRIFNTLYCSFSWLMRQCWVKIAITGHNHSQTHLLHQLCTILQQFVELCWGWQTFKSYSKGTTSPSSFLMHHCGLLLGPHSSCTIVYYYSWLVPHVPSCTSFRGLFLMYQCGLLLGPHSSCTIVYYYSALVPHVPLCTTILASFFMYHCELLLGVHSSCTIV